MGEAATAEREAPVASAAAVSPTQNIGAAADNVSIAIFCCRASRERSTLQAS